LAISTKKTIVDHVKVGRKIKNKLAVLQTTTKLW